MLQSTKRRLATLERSIELPLTADRFIAQVQERIRLTGVSFHEAASTLVESLSVESLNAVMDGIQEQLTGKEAKLDGDGRTFAETSQERHARAPV